jgi:hypothetical protein
VRLPVRSACSAADPLSRAVGLPLRWPVEGSGIGARPEQHVGRGYQPHVPDVTGMTTFNRRCLNVTGRSYSLLFPLLITIRVYLWLRVSQQHQTCLFLPICST